MTPKVGQWMKFKGESRGFRIKEVRSFGFAYEWYTQEEPPRIIGSAVMKYNYENIESYEPTPADLELAFLARLEE